MLYAPSSASKVFRLFELSAEARQCRRYTPHAQVRRSEMPKAAADTMHARRHGGNESFSEKARACPAAARRQRQSQQKAVCANLPAQQAVRRRPGTAAPNQQSITQPPEMVK